MTLPPECGLSQAAVGGAVTGALECSVAKCGCGAAAELGHSVFRGKRSAGERLCGIVKMRPVAGRGRGIIWCV